MKLLTEIENNSSSSVLNIYFNKDFNSIVLATSCGTMSFAFGMTPEQARKMALALNDAAGMADVHLLNGSADAI
jgi:hypothetical protein